MMHTNVEFKGTRIECKNCGACGPAIKGVDNAYSKWNTRYDDWQPIETVKEGERLLLRYYKGNSPDPMRTSAVNDYFHVEGYLVDGCWYDYAGRLLQKTSSKTSKNKVTHWKPLPTLNSIKESG